MTYETLLVVHDVSLRRDLERRAATGHVVVAPLDPTMGRRVNAVVFADRPTPDQCSSEVWLTRYRDWIDFAVYTRLVQGCTANVFGLSHWAK
ncbi:hypothetical protein KEM14_gp26 [Xanthomonas virus phiXaf18]|uniref:Uncharacterized protein n=1 Tax=Xanthomonas virus phiXaf18 TaxID=2653651 RepID=A0A5P8PQH1_9CAUD|nr:hypothetical protein KEM14_gp26 [Xanthomonas virus phiXaf18]QFR59540.1 hypothetical protein phiXaf18_26 [Xanthomonas virus phiXaf18]